MAWANKDDNEKEERVRGSSRSAEKVQLGFWRRFIGRARFRVSRALSPWATARPLQPQGVDSLHLEEDRRGKPCYSTTILRCMPEDTMLH